MRSINLATLALCVTGWLWQTNAVAGSLPTMSADSAAAAGGGGAVIGGSTTYIGGRPVYTSPSASQTSSTPNYGNSASAPSSPSTTPSHANTNTQSAPSGNGGATPAANRCQNLGINAEGLAYFSNSMPFNDLAMAAEPWHRNWGSKYAKIPITVDAQGNPVDASPETSVVSYISTFSWTPTQPSAPYVLTWQGNGLVTIAGSVKIISNNTHRLVFNLTGKKLWIYATTDRTDPVHAVHIVPLSMEYNTPLISSQYLSILKHFSTIRFMDLGETNNNPLVNWADRAKPGDYTQGTAKGIAYEYMIQIAQAAHANMWVNIPTLASDDYITQMAKLFAANLQPWQTVYVEYSNEAWNPGFVAYGQLQKMGLASGYPLNRATVWAYSDQVAKVANIWHQAFANNPNGPKVVVLMGGQEANGWMLLQEMAHNDNGHLVDAVTVAYYVGGYLGGINAGNAVQWRNATVADVDANLVKSALPVTLKVIGGNMTVAKQYGKPLLYYEGGQNLVAAGMEADHTSMMNDNAILNLFLNANLDQTGMNDMSPANGSDSNGMYGVYKTFLYDWQTQLGGMPYMMFALTGPYSKFGYWGMLQTQSDSWQNAPKMKAVYDYCGWQ